MMRVFGAELEVLATVDGRLTPDIVPKMMARAREIAGEQASLFTDQMNNRDTLTGYATLGEELLRQVDGPIHSFCGCVGTSGMLVGTGRVLKEADPRTRLVAIEPSASAVLSGGAPGAHNVEGVAPGFTPPLYDPTLVDDVVAVDEAEGRRMARTLAREEGIFAGTSTGLNVVAALRLARDAGPGNTVVTVAADSGLKYLRGTLYRD